MSNRPPLTQEQRRALWSRYQPTGATARASAGVGRPQRRPPRVAFDRATVAVRITHPGGGCRTAAVYAHDLSAGGLSFLYPGFLHANTAVSVALRRRDGGEAVAHGFVAWCRHVGGLWHGVGVGFASPLTPAAFVDPAGADAPPTAADVSAEPMTEVKPHPVAAGRGGLAGRVLYLDTQELDQGLFLHTVRRTRLNVTTVGDAASAVTAVAAGEFDVVCLDLNLGARQPTGERVMAELRAAGYAGPFVIVSDGDPDRLDRGRAAGEGGTGQTQVVAKPYAAADLLDALAAAMSTVQTDEEPMLAPPMPTTAEQPLHSHLAGQDGMAPLLRGFCDRAQAAAAELDRLLDPVGRQEQTGVSDARPVVAVRQLCQMLRGAGRGYGYPAVSAAADAALRALEDGMGGLGSAAVELRAVQAVCRRVGA